MYHVPCTTYHVTAAEKTANINVKMYKKYINKKYKNINKMQI